jgi:Asp-tRNA(Asn)/Glu-tRNA(Gln) amidotransferase A subunit family amidase
MLQDVDGQEVEKRALVIGYYDHDGYFPPTPGLRRAVAVAKQFLEKRGHKLVPFAVPDAEHAWKLYMDLMKADNLVQFAEAL